MGSATLCGISIKNIGTFDSGDDAIFLVDGFGLVLTKSQVLEMVSATEFTYNNASEESIYEYNEQVLESRRVRLGSFGEKSGPIKKQYNSGYVYLIKRGIYHKIGMTSNIKKRFQQISSQSPYESELVCYIETTVVADLELRMHNYYREKRIRGEWFLLSHDDVEYIKNEFDKARSRANNGK